MPTSGTNSSGSTSELSKNYSGFEMMGNDITTSVTLITSSVTGNYFNSNGESVKSIENASTFVITNNIKSLTVDVGLTGVSNIVNVNQTTSVTTYSITDKSAMDTFGGLQLINPKTTTSSNSSTMEFSSSPESLKTAVSNEVINNGKAIPNNASEHVNNTIQRTLEQEVLYNEHPVNNTKE